MNRQVEPSLNLPPADESARCIDARPLKGRVDALAEGIGQEQFKAWFSTAEFIDGSPPAIRVPTKFLQRWIEDRFHSAIEATLGSDVRIEVNETEARDA
jgi:chromosomal replication initiation ATPase DnaA